MELTITNETTSAYSKRPAVAVTTIAGIFISVYIVQIITIGDLSTFASSCLGNGILLISYSILYPDLLSVFSVERIKEDQQNYNSKPGWFTIISVGVVITLNVWQGASSLVLAFKMNNIFSVDYALTFVLSVCVVMAFALHETKCCKRLNSDSVCQKFKIRSKSYKPMKRCMCCVPLCNYCAVPLICVLYLVTLIDTIALNHLYFEPDLGPLATGKLVSTVSKNERLYFRCTGGSNKTQPTVLFSPGLSSSEMDAEWIRRNEKVQETGIKFCSMDRPGIGWSDVISDASKQNFANIAKLAHAAMKHVGIKGKVILMFHSNGGPFSLALGHVLESDPTINLVGAVAIDARSLAMYSEDMTFGPGFRKACSPKSKHINKVMTNLFALQKRLPRGFARLLIDGFDFLNLRTSMTYLPKDILRRYSSQAFARGRESAAYFEALNNYIDCGHALRGQSAFANLTRIEEFVTGQIDPWYRFCNFPDYKLQNNFSTVITGDGTSGLTGMHFKIILEKKYADIVSLGLVRVIKAVED